MKESGGQVPSADLFNMLLKAASDSGDMRSMETILEQMRQMRVMPTLDTIDALAVSERT